MRLLILGGTVFLGRAVVDAARERGHDVTIFHRGRRPAHRRDVVEVLGDRDGGLAALSAAGPWDAVVDTCGYAPRVVVAGTELLRARGVGSYVFVSSVSAYPDPPAGLSEATAAHDPAEGEAAPCPSATTARSWSKAMPGTRSRSLSPRRATRIA